MLVVRFEDLKREPEAECSRLADFLGLSRTKDELKTVVSQSSFQHLRRKEEKFGKSNPGRWPSDKRFYRQGEVGSYRAELSVATKEALLKQVAPAFEACGYEDGRG